MSNTSTMATPLLQAEQVGKILDTVKRSSNGKTIFLIAIGLLVAMLHPTFAAGFLLALKILQPLWHVLGLII